MRFPEVRLIGFHAQAHVGLEGCREGDSPAYGKVEVLHVQRRLSQSLGVQKVPDGQLEEEVVAVQHRRIGLDCRRVVRIGLHAHGIAPPHVPRHVASPLFHRRHLPNLVGGTSPHDHGDALVKPLLDGIDGALLPHQVVLHDVHQLVAQELIIDVPGVARLGETVRVRSMDDQSVPIGIPLPDDVAPLEPQRQDRDGGPFPPTVQFVMAGDVQDGLDVREMPLHGLRHVFPLGLTAETAEDGEVLAGPGLPVVSEGKPGAHPGPFIDEDGEVGLNGQEEGDGVVIQPVGGPQRHPVLADPFHPRQPPQHQGGGVEAHPLGEEDGLNRDRVPIGIGDVHRLQILHIVKDGGGEGSDLRRVVLGFGGRWGGVAACQRDSGEKTHRHQAQEGRRVPHARNIPSFREGVRVESLHPLLASPPPCRIFPIDPSSHLPPENLLMITLRQAVALVLLLFMPARARAQEGQALQPPGFDDYGRWESLSQPGERGGLSPDGRWIAYAVNRIDGENELRLANLADGVTEVIPFGTQPAYSADSRWIAYRIGYSEEEREAMRGRDEPVQDKTGLRNLETGETWTVDGIDSFSFSSDGAYLAMRHYPPETSGGSTGGGAGGRGGPSGSGGGTPGRNILVRRLDTGQDMPFGNVAQFAWSPVEDSHLLAMVISAADKLGNGVHLYEAETGEIRVLESADAAYSDLSWRAECPRSRRAPKRGGRRRGRGDGGGGGLDRPGRERGPAPL